MEPIGRLIELELKGHRVNLGVVCKACDVLGAQPTGAAAVEKAIRAAFPEIKEVGLEAPRAGKMAHAMAFTKIARSKHGQGA
mgnify:CR=1 FL=1